VASARASKTIVAFFATWPISAWATRNPIILHVSHMVDSGVAFGVVRVDLDESRIILARVARYAKIEIFMKKFFTTIAVIVDIGQFLSAKFARKVIIAMWVYRRKFWIFV
jgi:hypothetical protein